MSRAGVIAGLVGQIRATSGFEEQSGGTAVAYDHRVLAMGIDRAAIVLADAFDHSRMVIGGKTEMTYSLSVELYIRYNTDIAQAREDADTHVGNIVQRVNNNPTLGGSAFVSLVISGRVEDERMEIGKTPFLLEVLTVRATEHLDAL